MDNYLVEISNIALKLRVYPNKEQATLLNKSFGSCRFAYNYWLAERNTFYENEIKSIEDKSFKNQKYKQFKPTSTKKIKELFPWMKEVSAQGICNAYMDLQGAYQKFYKGQNNLPKFHSKKAKNSYRDSMMSQNCLNWNIKKIQIPKIGKVSFRNKKAPNWYKNRTKICSLTMSKTFTNKYYCTIIFEIKKKKIEKSKSIDESQAIGLDFDLHDFYISSEKESAKLNRGWKPFKQSSSKLRHLQRQFARTKPKSKNHEKLRLKVALEEERIANRRKDWQGKKV